MNDVASESSDRRTVIVIGGGIVGIACAHFLTEREFRVTVVDRDGVGAACSHANCGLITPSHALPLAEPGAVRMAIGSFFERNSPLRVKPRLDPALWSWLWRFAARCNEKDMLESGAGIHPLLVSSMSLYEQIVETESLDCEWQKRGLLFVYRTRKAFEAYRETNDLMAEHFDEGARPLDGDELADFEPALKPGLAGAWFYEHDAHLRPDKLVDAWCENLRSKGVSFVENREIERFDRADGRCTGVAAGGVVMTADEYVVATGALTPKLSQWLGCRIPIQPGKGYSMTMAHPEIEPKYPMLLPEHRVAVTPMKSAFRLGSIMEFAGYDESIPESRLRLLTDGAAHYLRVPTADPIEEKWYGWRPMTPDSRPIIDRSPAMLNVTIAAGHNMLGLSMAPGTGRLVAEIVAGEEPHLPREPYAVGRFG